MSFRRPTLTRASNCMALVCCMLKISPDISIQTKSVPFLLKLFKMFVLHSLNLITWRTDGHTDMLVNKNQNSETDHFCTRHCVVLDQNKGSNVSYHGDLHKWLTHLSSGTKDHRSMPLYTKPLVGLVVCGCRFLILIFDGVELGAKKRTKLLRYAVRQFLWTRNRSGHS